jgi:putative colanic acid biosynthesis acetyltransferase WcaF
MKPVPLNAKATQPQYGGASFSLSNRLFRLAWQIVWVLLASWTPPPMHGWRRFLLRLFGASVAASCDVRGSARVWYPPNLKLGPRALLAERVNCYNMAMIELGEGALVSQGAHLCAGNHDIDDPAFQLIAKPITLGPHSWVAADAFVAPGVTIGEGAVLGARAVAFRDLEPWKLYIGNPAREKRTRRKP